MTQTGRGMTGLETAIILVAFVITAAAFSFVVLNMRFITSQKTQSVVSASITNSSKSLLCDVDKVLEQGETFKIRCIISGIAGDSDTGLKLPGAYTVKYESFRVAVRPSNGAILTIERSIPGGVDEYTVLK